MNTNQEKTIKLGKGWGQLFRKTQVTIIPLGESLFASENAIEVSIQDDGGGEFLKINRGEQEFSLNPEEIAIICSALQYMGKQCQ